jgi:hypothetical protein
VSHFGVDPDPCFWHMDPNSDPYPAIFVTELQDTNKKQTLLKKFFGLLLFEGTFTAHHFSKIKKSKRIHKTVGNKVSLTIFA